MLRPGPIPRVSRQDESALARRYERDTGTPSCGISFQPERGSVDVLDRGGEMFGVSVRGGDVLSTVPGIDPDVAPSGSGCAECEASGGWWFHLRRCAQCGHIDASPSQHASRHAREQDHPWTRSYEPGEDWFYNYADGSLRRARSCSAAASPARAADAGSRRSRAQ